ncbi:hypothetical protein KR222_001331, partial [Zaprionus bogoriensis]
TESNIPKSKLAEDLGSLFATGLHSDVTIETADGREVRAHKNILSARNEVFAAMFTHDMEEKCQNRIKIDDFNEDVVNVLMYFIYTGEAPNLDQLDEKLLKAADKYNLVRLKTMCVKSLEKNLSPDNAVRICKLADLHNIAELKTAAEKYIKSHCEAVIKT